MNWHRLQRRLEIIYKTYQFVKRREKETGDAEPSPVSFSLCKVEYKYEMQYYKVQWVEEIE